MDTGKIKHKIRTTIYPNKVGAINAEAHQSLLIDLIDELDAGKQDRGEGMHPEGRYPSMSVGFADCLTGHGESTPAEFSFRASGGKSIADGTARIKTLRGNSVVWNNMAITAGYSGGFVHTNDILHLVSGHKYVMVRSKADAGFYCIPVINGAEVYDYAIQQGVFYKFFTSAYTTSSANTRVFAEKAVGGSMIVDLTLMYGEGNEPTTIEDFLGSLPLGVDLYSLNAGELLHSHIDAIKSVGDNAWDEQWEIGKYSVADGTKVAYDNAIRTRDYIKILPNTEYHKSGATLAFYWHLYYDAEKNYIGYEGYGMGETFRTPSNASYMRFYTEDGYGNAYKDDIMITLVHSGWKVDTDAGYQPYWEDTLEIDPRIRAAFPDGMMLHDYAYNRNGKGVIVKGSEVVDGEVVKRETPEVYEYEQPFNLDYRVADFGTEEALSSQPSAPIRADIIYQFNAVDLIRNLWARVQALESRM